MQPWRVLALIQVASLRSATTNTSHKKNKSKIEKIERRAKRAFSLIRLKIALFFACIHICYSKLSLLRVSNVGRKLNILYGQVARLVLFCKRKPKPNKMVQFRF